MERWMFEVTDLKQWSYCPRILFYRYTMPKIRPVTDLMRAGVQEHHAESGREERRSLRTYGLQTGERVFDLHLRSERLGLRGRIDLAIAIPSRDAPGAEAIVIEYKDSENPDRPHFRLQLAAYALLVEEAWALPVRRGFLYSIPLRKPYPVPISPALRLDVERTVEMMQRMVVLERIPDPPAGRRICVDCEFRRFCGDVV